MQEFNIKYLLLPNTVDVHAAGTQQPGGQEAQVRVTRSVAATMSRPPAPSWIVRCSLGSIMRARAADQMGVVAKST